MKDYGTVYSGVQPEAVKIDEYSVWVTDSVTEQGGAYRYHLVQYRKDEYVKRMIEQNQKTAADVEYIAMMTEVELE